MIFFRVYYPTLLANFFKYRMAFLHALSDGEINEYYKNEKLYLGTFAKDVIPSHLAKKKKGAMIINMGNSGGGGTHWVALLLNKNSTIYFDSFGVVPSEEVLSFIRKRTQALLCPAFYVDRQLQHLKASSCGWYCIYFINQCIIKDRDIIDVLSDDFTFNVNTNEGLLWKYNRHSPLLPQAPRMV